LHPPPPFSKIFLKSLVAVGSRILDICSSLTALVADHATASEKLNEADANLHLLGLVTAEPRLGALELAGSTLVVRVLPETSKARAEGVAFVFVPLHLLRKHAAASIQPCTFGSSFGAFLPRSLVEDEVLGLCAELLPSHKLC